MKSSSLGFSLTVLLAAFSETADAASSHRKDGSMRARSNHHNQKHRSHNKQTPISTAAFQSVPSNLKAFYDKYKSADCPNTLKGGFHSDEGDSKNFSYCSAPTQSSGDVVYLHGPNSYVNLDVDCDGEYPFGNDGRCAPPGENDTQGETRFRPTVAGYGANRNGEPVTDLNTNIHSYVVLGNEGSANGFTTFDPQEYGIEPLSVVAVVCDNKLFYGVWGDTNGDDGPPLVGETSLSLATQCFGQSMSGDNGHGENDVLYIAFPGQKAVPGKDGANWGASTLEEFVSSIKNLGDQLVAGI